jgi:hypothetical protein
MLKLFMGLLLVIGLVLITFFLLIFSPFICRVLGMYGKYRQQHRRILFLDVFFVSLASCSSSRPIN